AEADQRCRERERRMPGERPPEIDECLRDQRRRRQEEWRDLERAARDLPDREQRDGGDPGRKADGERALHCRALTICARSSCTIARHNARRCCMPALRTQGHLSHWHTGPTEASSPSPRATYSSLWRRMRLRCRSTISSGSSRFSSVVRQGRSLGAWNAVPAILTGFDTCSPATRTLPWNGNC